MKTLLFIVGFVFFAGARAEAKDYRFSKRVNPEALQKELVSKGYKVRHITCVAADCTLALEDSETKNPKAAVDAYVFVDGREKDRQELAAIKALTAKWRAGTITPVEKDDLILRFIERQVSSL